MKIILATGLTCLLHSAPAFTADVCPPPEHRLPGHCVCMNPDGTLYANIACETKRTCASGEIMIADLEGNPICVKARPADYED